jgi:two-component system, OmpR family, sensor histidine kinase VanS
LKISLTTKIFLYVLLSIIFLGICVGLAGLIFFEKLFYLQQENDYKKAAKDFTAVYSGNIQESIELIGELEDKYGLNVTITDQIGIIRYTTVIKGNPWGGTAERWKNDNVSIPAYIREALSEGKTTAFYTENEIYGTKVMTIAAPLENDEVLFLELILQPVKDSINYMFRFLLFAGSGTVLLGLAVSYLISLKTAAPVSKLNMIAKRISGSDYSIKYNDVHNDELDELGEALNIMSARLESSEKQISQYAARIQVYIEKENIAEKKRLEFISNISQELKKPISVISSHARKLSGDIMLEKGGDEYHCKAIAEESLKMANLVTELMEVSMLESDDALLNIENFDIVSLIENVGKRYKKELEDRDIKFVICKDDGDVTVKGDPYRIEQVIVNLLDNAIRYIEDEKGIVIKILKNDKKAIVKVFNTGRSTPYEELDRIWDRFCTDGRISSDDSGDTRLGLYIVKKVLKLHKSGFGVRNLKGGVEFWFDIECF